MRTQARRDEYADLVRRYRRERLWLYVKIALGYAAVIGGAVLLASVVLS